MLDSYQWRAINSLFLVTTVYLNPSDNGLTWRENISLREYVNPTIAFHSLTDISVSDNEIFVGQVADSYMAYYANGLIYSSDRGLQLDLSTQFPNL